MALINVNVINSKSGRVKKDLCILDILVSGVDATHTLCTGYTWLQLINEQSQN